MHEIYEREDKSMILLGAPPTGWKIICLNFVQGHGLRIKEFTILLERDLF